MLSQLIGGDNVPVHFHIVQKNGNYLKTLSSIEQDTNAPLRISDPRFPTSSTKWLFEQGIHIGWDLDNSDIPFVVRIRFFFVCFSVLGDSSQ